MNKNKQNIDVNTGLEQTPLKEYAAPQISDYGKMSELTQTLSGPGVGCDGGFPSYLTQSS